MKVAVNTIIILRVRRDCSPGVSLVPLTFLGRKTFVFEITTKQFFLEKFNFFLEMHEAGRQNQVHGRLICPESDVNQ